MCSQEELSRVLDQLTTRLRALFGMHLRDVILFGSYARNDAEYGSDVDVLVLVDLPREEIVSYRRRVAAIAGDILMSDNLLVSPIIENQAFFIQHRNELPFYRNIDREGVRIGA